MANKTKTTQKLRRNERERRRVHQVNLGFNTLRDRVPHPKGTKQKLSKVETLREAARYIEYLRSILGENTFGACMSSTFSNGSFDMTNELMSFLPPISSSSSSASSLVTSCYYMGNDGMNTSPCASSFYGSETSFDETTLQ
ncbi:unnamed protein product [Auanema sp. JU1783]|nr:unnamed protein product [Auanema sp. JU1783]